VVSAFLSGRCFVIFRLRTFICFGLISGVYFQLFSGCMATCGPMCELSISLTDIVVGLVVPSCCVVYSH